MTDNTAITNGAHHIGLTVPDLTLTREFLEGALGFRVVGENADYPAIFLSDGQLVITLWRAENPEKATPFDRKQNIGLHHLALKLSDDADLDNAYSRVSAWPGVEIEFQPQPPGQGSRARHFICSIPGGLRLEIFAPAAA
ncbi:MAG: glyoxalase [Parvularcula sp.]|jgi:catechol 2,3-dioxygenase-like lactoylglutathione lyase family enzyme|nr:glyoxalase [Parvularcula sp.]